MAQHSSRWLNRGAMALLFAGASFVRPDLGTSSSCSHRCERAHSQYAGHDAYAFALGASCFLEAQWLSPLRRKHTG